MSSKSKLFLILSSVFITSLVMANIVGITKFVLLFKGLPFEMSIPVGMLAYPITFLCTDLVSELYGKKHANFLVFVGLLMNILLIIILSIGNFLPTDSHWIASILKNGNSHTTQTYDIIYTLMIRATLASMVGYLIAQYIDVYLFHFWKKVTKGKHLWLRNNASTMTSQLIDTIAVISITFYGVLPITTIVNYILAGYIFKVISAALDTPFMYYGVHLFKKHIETSNT